MKAEPVGSHRIEVHFASGNGWNKIYIVPSLHMVLAITSSAYNQRYGQRRSQDILLRGPQCRAFQMSAAVCGGQAANRKVKSVVVYSLY
jgi:hypothetical protein